MRKARRTAVIALASMVSASVLSHALRPTQEVHEQGASIDLERMFPVQFGEWTVDRSVVPVMPSPDLQQVIDQTYSQTLARTYRDASGYPVMLSVAYGGRQEEGMNTHRPEICYPAQGFPIRQSPRDATLTLDGKSIPVRMLVAGNGARNEPIIYWLVVGRQTTRFGLGHKWVTLKYGLTGKIPDGMLIRVSAVDDDDTRAFGAQERFLQTMLAAMPPQDRAHILGAL